jgi:hypothetical protein
MSAKTYAADGAAADVAFPVDRHRTPRTRSGTASLGRCENLDFPLEPLSQPVFLGLQVETGPAGEPEALRRSEIARQPKRGVGCDSALAVDDLVDPARGTEMAFANLYWLTPSGFRNSSRSTSPGSTLASLAA